MWTGKTLSPPWKFSPSIDSTKFPMRSKTWILLPLFELSVREWLRDEE